MNTNECEVYFALNGDDFDPNEITKLLQIEPTRIRKNQELIPGRHKKINSWILSTGKVVHEYIDTYEMSSKIIEILAPKIDLIIKAIEMFKATPHMEVVIWFATNENISTPAIGFEKSTIEFLGEIGGFIDIDTYQH